MAKPKPSDMSTTVRDLTALYTLLIGTLVDKPEAVNLKVKQTATGYCFRLRVAPGDAGKVIGKQGRTARSLRVLLSAAALPLGVTFSLDIEEEETKKSVTTL